MRFEKPPTFLPFANHRPKSGWSIHVWRNSRRLHQWHLGYADCWCWRRWQLGDSDKMTSGWGSQNRNKNKTPKPTHHARFLCNTQVFSIPNILRHKSLTIRKIDVLIRSTCFNAICMEIAIHSDSSTSHPIWVMDPLRWQIDSWDRKSVCRERVW